MSPPRENLRVSRSVVDEVQEPIGGLVGEIQDTNLRFQPPATNPLSSRRHGVRGAE